MSHAVTIIGIGDNGCVGLSSQAVNAVAQCQVLAGGERHLEFFPQFEGKKISFKGGLMKAVVEIVESSAENNICVLASGDPMFYGVGSLLIKKMGHENCLVLPQPSSIALAFSRAGLKWDDAEIVSLHGRSREGFLTRLKHFKKIAVLTDDKNCPAALAKYMLDHGLKNWRSHVCENLAGVDERIRTFESLEDLSSCEDISPLNVLILENTNSAWQPAANFFSLHEDEFAKRLPKKGLITKKEVRTLSLAELNLRRDSIVWDIGAASGSIAISAAITAYEGRSYAIEVDEKSLVFCRENIETFAVDNVRVIAGRAPEILSDIEDDPDAIFVGGSKGSLRAIIEYSLSRLKTGGRLVVNAITFENVQEAYQTFKDLEIKAETTLLSVSRGVPLAHYHRYEALNPIHIFSCTK